MTEKITLNLSEYRPYRKMGQSCQLKDIAEFNVHWPIYTTASNLADNDLNVRYMRGNDIDEIVQLWKNVYPEAYGSPTNSFFPLNGMKVMSWLMKIGTKTFR